MKKREFNKVQNAHRLLTGTRRLLRSLCFIIVNPLPMIKFFRKIRHKLLVENLPDWQAGKFSRYLLYAVGEIVLVVIGILIALQVNNWNEVRKERHQEKKHLVSLHEELEQNAKILSWLSESIERSMGAVNYIFGALSRPNELQNIDSIYNALGKTVTLYNTILSTNVYAEMESSGKLHLIRTDSLREAITSFYARIYRINQIENMGSLHHWKSFYLPFINKHFDAYRVTKASAGDLDIGMTDPQLPQVPFWSLDRSNPLKVQLVNELGTYYSGCWWVRQEQMSLIDRIKKINSMITLQLEES